MKFYLLASGSKGNCFVVNDGDSTIVIDCGSTIKYLKNSFSKIGIEYTNINALFVTHNHKDHIGQIKMFKNQRIYSPFYVQDIEINLIYPYDKIAIGEFLIQAIPLSHDASVTVGYILESKNEKLVYITDTGYIQDSHLQYIEHADYYIVESNHDVELLMQSKRPMSIKHRILSDVGHLSNEDCAQMLSKVVGSRAKEIVLAHMSEEANDRKLAAEVISTVLKQYPNIRLRAAEQFEILEGGAL